jgi:hypothetical protein
MVKLGLCNPPELIYLYVKAGQDGNAGAYLWYRYIIETEKTIPVQERGLAGNLIALKLTSKTFKDKENMKLDIVVQADETYVIRTGIETNFAKTFLLCVSQIQDFSKPLVISVAPGEENVVFCRLYDGLTKQRIKAEWNKNADWASIIATVQQKLGQRDEPADVLEKQAPDDHITSQIFDLALLAQEVISIAKRKNITQEQVNIGAFKYYGKHFEQLSQADLLAYRDRLSQYQQAAN